MPTLLVKDGFKFFFYANEHEPKHFHVTKAGRFAKIEMRNFRVINNCFRSGELKKVLWLAETHGKDFERKWDEFFKRQITSF